MVETQDIGQFFCQVKQKQKIMSKHESDLFLYYFFSSITGITSIFETFLFALSAEVQRIPTQHIRSTALQHKTS